MDNLSFDDNLFIPMKTGGRLDPMLSSEGGLMKGTNYAFVGDPGVGKSTVMLDVLADLQAKGAKVFVHFRRNDISIDMYMVMLKDILKFGQFTYFIL